MVVLSSEVSRCQTMSEVSFALRCWLLTIRGMEALASKIRAWRVKEEHGFRGPVVQTRPVTMWLSYLTGEVSRKGGFD